MGRNLRKMTTGICCESCASDPGTCRQMKLASSGAGEQRTSARVRRHLFTKVHFVCDICR